MGNNPEEFGGKSGGMWGALKADPELGSFCEVFKELKSHFPPFFHGIPSHKFKNAPNFQGKSWNFHNSKFPNPWVGFSLVAEPKIISLILDSEGKTSDLERNLENFPGIFSRMEELG